MDRALQESHSIALGMVRPLLTFTAEGLLVVSRGEGRMYRTTADRIIKIGDFELPDEELQAVLATDQRREFAVISKSGTGYVYRSRQGKR